MAAILGPGGPSTATYFAADGPGDLFWGDHLWHDRPPPQIKRKKRSGPERDYGKVWLFK